MGDYQKALQHVQKSIEKREASWEVLDHLGDIYLKLGQPQKARDYWERALQKDPTNEEIRKKLGKGES